jgi:hypothetical protein
MDFRTSVRSQIKKLGEEALGRMRELREYRSGDAVTARVWLSKHVERIVLWFLHHRDLRRGELNGYAAKPVQVMRFFPAHKQQMSLYYSTLK